MKPWTGILLATTLSMMGSAAIAGTLGTVNKLLRETISIYNDKGVFIEKRPAWKIPAGGAPIVDEAGGHLGIHDASGRMVYLRSSEVEASGRPDNCVVTDTASRGSTRIAASEGVGSGMSGTASRCVK